VIVILDRRMLKSGERVLVSWGVDEPCWIDWSYDVVEGCRGIDLLN